MDMTFFLANFQQPLTDSIIGNTALSLLIILFGIFDSVYGFVEFLEKDGSVMRLLKASVLTVITIAMCLFVKLVYALLIIAVAICLLILFSARKRSRKENKQAKTMMGAEGVDLPLEQDLTASAEYKRAVDCINDGRPREAADYLRNCRGKITGQARFFIRYADALMGMGNFRGALTKLESMPSKHLNQKKVFINVMVRKGRCYHGLYEYAKELECYSALLAKNIQPEVNYFKRAKVKLRMLEVFHYLPSAEQAIVNVSGSQQAFIESIFADLDKAQQYNKQNSPLYEGQILSCKGAAYILKQDFQKGWELLTEAQKKNEFYPGTYTYLGIYYYQKGDADRAIKTFKKAASYDKEADAASEVAFYCLAKIYLQEAKFDLAIHYAAQSLSIFPHRSECYKIQGDCYKMKSMYTEAIDCYTQAIKLKPEVDYYVKRAECYYNRYGEYECAYHDMRAAIKLHDCAKFQLIAALYKSRMDREKGVQRDKEDLDAFFAPYQNDPANFLALAIIYSEYQYFDDALYYYRKTIEKRPFDSSAHYDLAVFLLENDQTNEAIDELQTAIDLRPTVTKYYEVLADCYQKVGETAGEIQTRRRLEQVKRLNCDLNKKSGDAVYCLKKYQAAIRCYEAGLAYHRCAEVLNNLACAYFAQEEYDLCVKCLEEAITKDKTYFLAYFNLGNCQLRMSQTGEGRADMREAAKKNFETACRLNAEFERASMMLKSMDAGNIEMVIDQSNC